MLKNKLKNSLVGCVTIFALGGCAEDQIEGGNSWRLDENQSVSNESIEATRDDLREAIVACYEQEGVPCDDPNLACGIYAQNRPEDDINIFELATAISRMGGDTRDLDWNDRYNLSENIPSWSLGPVNYNIDNGFMNRERFDEENINVTMEDIQNFSDNCSEYFEE